MVVGGPCIYPCNSTALWERSNELFKMGTRNSESLFNSRSTLMPDGELKLIMVLSVSVFFIVGSNRWTILKSYSFRRKRA